MKVFLAIFLMTVFLGLWAFVFAGGLELLEDVVKYYRHKIKAKFDESQKP